MQIIFDHDKSRKMREKNQTDGAVIILQPTKYLQTTKSKENGKPGASNGKDAALIILNSPLKDFEYFQRLYDNASFVVCADAGANRLYELLTRHFSDLAWDTALRKAAPNAIHGDLDSLSDHVRSCYSKLGVTISQDPDQYSTDFGKCIKKVIEHMPDVHDILMLGSIGGRIDHGIGLLHELYREQKLRHPGVRFWLFSEASVTVLLQEGTTIIDTPLAEGLITRNAGILPLYGPAVISLKGFEWDVDDWPTELGGQVSTSNHIVADQISITTNKDLLFTVERTTKR